jgi:chromosome segregation ATPase
MDQAQLEKLVQYIDEERRKDRAIIVQLQERIEGLSREVEARQRYAQSIESSLNEVKIGLTKASGWTSATELLRAEFNQLIERIEDQRTKAERELVRTRQIEIESIVRQLNEIKREIKPYPRVFDDIEARKVEDGRLADLISRAQLQIMEIERRFDAPTAQLAYLEEQRRQEIKRVAAIEQEIPDIKKKIEIFPPRLQLLEESIRRKQTDIEEAGKLLEAQSQLIENQRVADIRRERQFAEYAELIEKLKTRADEVTQQVVGFVQLREEIKRELSSLPDFQERLEVRVNELFELQRDAADRAARNAEAFRDMLEKDWKSFVVLQEEKWHDRDRRIGEYEPRLTDIEEELPRLQPQIAPLYDILEAFTRSYANSGREWLAEANQLFERARINVPSDIKPSRRQRRKQQAAAEANAAALAADESRNGSAVDMNADLVE